MWGEKSGRPLSLPASSARCPPTQPGKLCWCGSRSPMEGTSTRDAALQALRTVPLLAEHLVGRPEPLRSPALRARDAARLCIALAARLDDAELLWTGLARAPDSSKGWERLPRVLAAAAQQPDSPAQRAREAAYAAALLDPARDRRIRIKDARIKFALREQDLLVRRGSSSRCAAWLGERRAMRPVVGKLGVASTPSG